MGFITEFIGRITIEDIGYKAVASIISKECSIHTDIKGTQQRKSVAIMRAI